MKKNLKKFFAAALAGSLAFAAAAPALALPAFAAEESTETYRVFVAFGGDAAEEGDWGLSYAGGDVSGDITVTDGEIKVGDTVKVGLEFAEPVVNAWYFAPTILAENVVDASFDVKAYVDGTEVTLDMSAGDNWWYEGTGDFTDKQAVRIAGGFNEWGAQYMAEPAGFKKLEFEITANSIMVGEAEVGEAVESTEEYDMYLAFGGDAAEEGDWGLAYAGGEASEGITVTDAKIKSGETASVKLEFANPVVNVWYFAPFIVAENVVDASFDVKAFVDGEEVALDMSAGDNWWYEGTGDFTDKQAVRIAGGFNEWGAQYMAEPAGFTSLEFQVTANSIKVGEAVADEAAASPAGEVDLDGTYNAYIGFQTPVFSFRNAWDEPNYGKGTDYFNQVTGWDGNDAVVLPGTFTDAVIAGNGTYTVSAEGLDFPAGEFDSQDYMNLIFVSTDIPKSDAITISDVVLEVGGQQPSINPMISPEEDDLYTTIAIQNVWNPDIATIGYYSVPFDSLKVTFTVSGFNYDNPDATGAVEEEVAPEPEPETVEEATPAEEPAPAEEAAPAAAEPAPAPQAEFPWIPVVIIAVVVVAAIIVGVVVYSKKKKQ